MKLTPSSFASLALSAVLSFSVQAAESVKIGIVGPFSGPLTQYGEMQLNGAHAAIDMINEPWWCKRPHA